MKTRRQWGKRILNTTLAGISVTIALAVSGAIIGGAIYGILKLAELLAEMELPGAAATN